MDFHFRLLAFEPLAWIVLPWSPVEAVMVGGDEDVGKGGERG